MHWRRPRAEGMQAHGLHIVAADGVAAQAWRNGVGRTRELFAWPEPSSWQLRISLADIVADAPFSAFPGVERWFAVVEGDGVVLHRGARIDVLGIDSAPLRFDGADAPQCRLQGGATRDLNLMVRRGAGQAAMRRVQPGTEWVSEAPLRALFSVDATRLQIDDADAATVPAWTLVLSLHAGRQRWRVVDDGQPLRACWLEFRPEGDA